MKQDSIKYRRTKSSDLLEAFRLVTQTFNHLRRKAGLKSLKHKQSEPPPLMVHLLKTDPQGSFVATDAKGKLIGFTMSQMREEEWYLAYLFVLPTYQSRGVGQKLLAKAMKYGTENQCKRRALATLSYNPHAVAMYSKLGMSPQRTLVMMGRKVETLPPSRRLKPKVPLTLEVVTDERYINRLSKLDRRARGLARPEEHFFWLGDSDSTMLVFHDARKIAGYCVINSRSAIGPVVSSKPEYLSSVLAMSIAYDVRTGHERQAITVHGEQSDIVQQLLSAGFRVFEITLQMATEPIADPKLYIPGNLTFY
jgi:ribosomal protein S18 acetylase RimI-like enzyme